MPDSKPHSVPDLLERAESWLDDTGRAHYSTAREATRMGKSGYAPRKDKLADWVVEARPLMRGLIEQLETAHDAIRALRCLLVIDADGDGETIPQPVEVWGPVWDQAREALGESSPASEPSGEQTREQLLERIALTVKQAIDGGSFAGTLFETQVSGPLWLLYGDSNQDTRGASE